MKKKRTLKHYNIEKIINRRFIVFLVFTIILFGIIIFRLTDVMLNKTKYYKEELTKLTYSKVSGSSTPRGRIYDRNYNILVDNKSLKTITYQKKKGTTNIEMINLATLVSPHIDLDYSRLNDRNKREYFFAKNKDICDKLVTKKEIEKVHQRKMTQRELDELKLQRIKNEDLEFSEEEKKIAYLYYLINKGYKY